MWGNLLDLLTLEHWWEYPAIYLAGCWVITAVILRYAPAECPEMVQTRVWDSGGRSKLAMQRRPREYCMDHHVFHIKMREFAFLYAVTWPLVLVLGIPALVVFLYGWTMIQAGKIGRPDPKEVKADD